MRMLITASAILVSIGRFTVPGHDLSSNGTIIAFAHIWFGFLSCTIYFYFIRCNIPVWMSASSALFVLALFHLAIFSYSNLNWPNVYESLVHDWIGAILSTTIFRRSWVAFSMLILTSSLELVMFFNR